MNTRIRQLLLVLGSSLIVHKYYWFFALDLSSASSTTATAPPSDAVLEQGRATRTPPQRAALHQVTISTHHTDLQLPPIVERSLHIPKDSSNITAAVCHKSLFGDIDLWMVLDWVAYHRLLGFDRIFMSYASEVKRLDGFAELDSLPYVTLFEDADASVLVINNDGYNRLGTSTKKNASALDGYGCKISERSPVAQLHLEMQCLDHYARDFDWVLLADADEYLWFKDRVGVKEFLDEHKQYDYLSFGKWMYTTKHRVNTTTTGFNMQNNPFSAGIYCTMQNRRGMPLHKCARHNSKAKVIVKPSVHHGHVCVHGTHIPRTRNESMQFSAHTAHLKEWHGATLQTDTFTLSVIHNDTDNFSVYSAKEANIRGFGLYPKNADGGVTLKFDDKLEGWLNFVATRGGASRSGTTES